ncbi:MAG: YCF48-related protein [Chloroflexota bacterium]|nr:YCF48-related protein [Chloroflexota bacterium]
MAKKRRAPYRTPPPRKSAFSVRLLLVGVMVLAAVAALGVAFVLSSGDRTAGGPVSWSTLGTQDVHSLVFDPADAEHLFFGHHGGLLESRDGGRTWQQTALRGVDAMNVSSPSDGFFQIAGHDVYIETTDGGRTWADVPNDLPGLDLHAFAADPGDDSHAWTYSVGFGLFETTDRGRTWQLRQPGSWGALTAFDEDATTVLVALGPSGLARSEDGGRTWAGLTRPPGQLTSLAASNNGAVLYAGTSEGLSRSTDRGRTWARTTLDAVVVTVAAFGQDPDVVAIVDDKTRFFRSSDAGESWPGPGREP